MTMTQQEALDKAISNLKKAEKALVGYSGSSHDAAESYALIAQGWALVANQLPFEKISNI